MMNTCDSVCDTKHSSNAHHHGTHQELPNGVDQQQDTQHLLLADAVGDNAQSEISEIRLSNANASLAQHQLGQHQFDIPHRPSPDAGPQHVAPRQQGPLEEQGKHQHRQSMDITTPGFPINLSMTAVSAAAAAAVASTASSPSDAPTAYQPPPPYPYPSHSTTQEFDPFTTYQTSPPIALSQSPKSQQHRHYPPPHQIHHRTQAHHQQQGVSPQPELHTAAAAAATQLYARSDWSQQYLPQAPPMATLYGSSLPSSPRSSQVYSFVPIPGNQQGKRPRRRYEEIERIYHCGWQECPKAYGTLNHLNAHVMMQSHGPKRTPEEFREIRKEWKARKREEKSRRRAAEERERQAETAAAAAATDVRSTAACTGSVATHITHAAPVLGDIPHGIGSGAVSDIGSGTAHPGDGEDVDGTWGFGMPEKSLGMSVRSEPGAAVEMGAVAGPPGMGAVSASLIGTEHGQPVHQQLHQHLNPQAHSQGQG